MVIGVHIHIQYLAYRGGILGGYGRTIEVYLSS